MHHGEEPLGQVAGQEQHRLRARLSQELHRNAGEAGEGSSNIASTLRLLQGMFSVNDARKRSSYGYHTVTTVTTVTDDRRGTLGQETEVVPRPGSVRAGSG